MKLAEIKSTRERHAIPNSEELTFFNALYHHCMTALETLPDDSIREVFEKDCTVTNNVNAIFITQSERSHVTEVCFDIGTTNEEDEDDEQNVAWVVLKADTRGFDFRGFTVMINLQCENYDKIVSFCLDDEVEFDCFKSKMIFGKYFVNFTETPRRISVLTSCFQ